LPQSGQEEINRFSTFYFCVTVNDKRKYNWIEAQSRPPQRRFVVRRFTNYFLFFLVMLSDNLRLL